MNKKNRPAVRFARVLRMLMHYHDISTTDVALETDKSLRQVYHWTNGLQMPRAEDLKTLCELFDNVSISQLLGDEELTLVVTEKEEAA